MAGGRTRAGARAEPHDDGASKQSAAQETDKNIPVKKRAYQPGDGDDAGPNKWAVSECTCKFSKNGLIVKADPKCVSCVPKKAFAPVAGVRKRGPPDKL